MRDKSRACKDEITSIVGTVVAAAVVAAVVAARITAVVTTWITITCSRQIYGLLNSSI